MYRYSTSLLFWYIMGGWIRNQIKQQRFGAGFFTFC